MKTKLSLLLLAAALGVCACDDGDDGEDGDGGGATGGSGQAGSGGGGAGGGSGGAGGSPAGWLSAPVQVTYDGNGIPYIQGQTDHDVVAALGYLHAQSRFFQMDLFRRVGSGQIAGLISLQASSDYYLRPYFSSPQGEPLEELVYESLDETEKAELQAYADGVNRWLADVRAGRNGARLTEEYALSMLPNEPSELRDWRPQDSIAFARYMVWDLSDSGGDAVAYGTLFADLDPAVAPDLLTLRPAERSYTMPASGVPFPMRARPDLAAIREIQGRVQAARKALDAAEARTSALSLFLHGPNFQPGETGSNNWVLGPSRTLAGKGLLANDPHLGLGNPAIWYFAVLDSKTAGQGSLHVGGGSFPGAPMVPIGRNEDVAWGATVAYFDVTDDYLETLNADGTAVIFNGVEVPIVTREHTFEVYGQEPRTKTLEWVPHHGPIISKDLATRTAVSSRWTGHEPTLEVRALRNLMRAGSVGDAKTALEDFGAGAQNWVLLDRQGQIGWFPRCNIPSRPWASAAPGRAPWLPLPGDGSAEWGPYLPTASLPQLFDPPAGFVATANQDMTGTTEDGDPSNDGHPVLQSSPDLGFRHKRIVELIEELGNSHTPETMRGIQADTRSLFGARLVPHLLAAAGADPAGLTPDGEQLVAALTSWGFSCPTGLTGTTPDSLPDTDPTVAAESSGCLAFHVALTSLFKTAFGDELTATGRRVGGGGAGVQQLARALVLLLDHPADALSADTLFDDVSTAGNVESRTDVMLAALNDAGSILTTRLGPPAEWQWGRMHTITFASQLSDLAPTLNNGPYANDGGLFTVDVANPGPEGANYTHSAGASLRIVTEADAATGLKSWFQLSGGQDLHRDGEYYGSMIDRWLANEQTPLPFSAEEAAASKQGEQTLSP